jgi:hypothetical protein
MCGVISMFFGEKPVMIAAPNGEAFATRGEDGQMYLMNEKADNWLRKIWNENFKLAKNVDDCLEKEFCIYKTIKFNQNGEVWLNEKKLDMCAGGYFYGVDNIRFVPMWNCAERRVWTINNAQ